MSQSICTDARVDLPLTLHPAIKRAADAYDISALIASEYQALFEKCTNWFAPTNRHNDEYLLAQMLHSLGLLDMRKTALHRSGRFSGFRVEFQQSALARVGDAP